MFIIQMAHYLSRGKMSGEMCVSPLAVCWREQLTEGGNQQRGNNEYASGGNMRPPAREQPSKR